MTDWISSRKLVGGGVPIREASSFQRMVCTGFNDLPSHFFPAEEDKKFASLKVKSLDEIRQEKQQSSSNNPLPQAHSTTFTRPHSHTTSYNLVYTPRSSNSPSVPTTSSETSFKLTSVLQSTGLTTTNSTTRNTTQAGGVKLANVSTANSQVQLNARSQPVNLGGVSKPAVLSQGKSKISPFVTQPTQVDGSRPIKNDLPRVKVGVATMGTTTSIFGAQRNPSSVFSPNYRPGAKLDETRNKKLEQDLRESIIGARREREMANLKVGGEGRTTSTNTWNDKREREGREGKATRIVKLENATATIRETREVTNPPAKKVA